MSRISLHTVQKSFGAHCVLSDISIEVARGEILVVLGTSGAGKSTLMNLISGLEQPTRGRIYFDDRDVTTCSPGERNVAVVLQSPSLYPAMSVRGNIGFSLRMKGMSKAAIGRRVDQIAHLLQIHALLDRMPQTLSGGQQQRVAIARALVREPSALLMDEPLSSLDTPLRSAMRLELKRLHVANERTTLYVTHDFVEAMTLGDRVAIIDQGRIAQCATPEEVYLRPQTLAVARLLGVPAMNLLNGRVEYHDGAPAAAINGGILALPELALPRRPVEGEPVIVGFRPESVQLQSEGAADCHVGRVISSERLGADYQVQIDLGGFEITARTAPARLAPGESVWIRIDGSSASLFNPVSGRRLN